MRGGNDFIYLGCLVICVNSLPLFPESDTPFEVAPLFYESIAWKAGYSLVCGVDEAGRGPLAGPVVAAAVIMPEGITVKGVRDSKTMTERARERVFHLINEKAIAVSVGVVSHKIIDEQNILKASLEAMKQAVLSLEPAPLFCLVDGIYPVPLSIAQKCLIKGDRISHSISAASIVAKVYRDRLMVVYAGQFPVYGFSENKGYGTAKHLEAIRKYGASPIHRRTFRGVC